MLVLLHFVLAVVGVFAQVDDLVMQDTNAVIPIEHMLPGDDKWSSRGYIAVNSLRAQSISFVQDEQLSREEVKLLRDGALINDLYRIRVPVNKDSSKYVSSFTYACGIVESGLSEMLTLCMDSSSNTVVSVSIVTVPPHCTGAHNPLSNTGVFNTTVEIQRIEQGPTPDTSSYLQKLEQEKIAKQRGDNKDNRSFFAKYWMYIVPVVLIMMLSNSGQPEQGGGGGR